MGILASMYTARSGLTGMGEALGVYGDNIANSNTIGFKTARPDYADVVLQGQEVGRGMMLSGVTPLSGIQGQIVQTDSPTDLSISGAGYFVLKGKDGQSYTRNGSFHFDKEGKMITAEGHRVLGFQADETGKITSRLDPISIDRTVIDAKATDTVKLFMNLDLRADVRLKFDPKKPEQTSHFATGTLVYDSMGTPHTVTLYFNREKDGEWTYRAMAKGEEVVDGKKGEMVEQASGKLKFDSEGRLEEVAADKNEFNFVGGAKKNAKIEFKFGDPRSEGGDGLGTTQYGTDSEAYKTIQDGYTAGTLVGMNFADNGLLQAIYSNGEQINIAQAALAKFENPEALIKLGGNRSRESRESGQATIGLAQQGGRGAIAAKSLESSTTDIANEFINLMNTQRSFQANGKVISVADEMMQDVLNLRRT